MSITFENSPLNELIFGVQFNEPLLNINDVMEIHGLYKAEYTRTEVKPLLPSIVESVDKIGTQKILTDYSSRYQIYNKNNDRVIQIQPDKLFFNWRREESSTKYPRFFIIYDEFTSIIDKISQKLDKKLFEHINQYETMYIDHIYLKDFNLLTYDLSEIFTMLNGNMNFKHVDLNFAIPFEEIGGVLRSSLKSGLKNPTKDKIFILENTCRGFQQVKNMRSWFSMAHEILMTYFCDSITDKAKYLWEYKEG